MQVETQVMQSLAKEAEDLPCWRSEALEGIRKWSKPGQHNHWLFKDGK